MKQMKSYVRWTAFMVAGLIINSGFTVYDSLSHHPVRAIVSGLTAAFCLLTATLISLVQVEMSAVGKKNF